MAKETALFSDDFTKAIRLFKYEKGGLTQKEISKKVGFPNSAFSQYLGGKQRISVHDGRIIKIKEIIGFTGEVFKGRA